MSTAKTKDDPVPHEVREAMLIRLGREHDLRTFVETGTAQGAMLEALLPYFDHLYSVELEPTYYQYSSTHIGLNAKVKVSWGDSVPWLQALVPTLDEPALISLDAHFSGPGTAQGPAGDTPVAYELGSVMEYPALCPVVVVDDARLFGYDPAYPSITYVRLFSEERGYSFEHTQDAFILRAHQHGAG